MERLLEILSEIKEDVDFSTCTTLPQNFNSAETLYKMVQRLQED